MLNTQNETETQLSYQIHDTNTDHTYKLNNSKYDLQFVWLDVKAVVKDDWKHERSVMVAKATGLFQQQNYVIVCVSQASPLLHTSLDVIAIHGQTVTVVVTVSGLSSPTHQFRCHSNTRTDSNGRSNSWTSVSKAYTTATQYETRVTWNTFYSCKSTDESGRATSCSFHVFPLLSTRFLAKRYYEKYLALSLKQYKILPQLQ